MDIRNTTEADEPALRRLHEVAFGLPEGPTVAELALALLHDPTAVPKLSLGAYEGPDPLGHVLFTSVRISGFENAARARILAPLAVHPDRQRTGVGDRLVRQGLSLLAESGCELVFVLGHPGYYGRFGFQPAGPFGFLAPYPIPEVNASAWMVLELAPGLLGRVRGPIQCAKSLEKPEHW